MLSSCSQVSTIKIGSLEVMSEDLGKMKWENAKKACADLGDGWRLPTKDGLNILYENKDKIGGFASNHYWSSTEGDSYGAWEQSFSDGGQFSGHSDNNRSYVRAVRAFGCNSNDSEIEELKEVRSILDESEVVYDLTEKDEGSVGYAQCVEGDCENGQGTFTWADGSKYVGEWKDGKRNGQGTYTWADGDKYVGEWKDDKSNGQGTYTYHNGDKYVGESKYDKPQGQGTYTYADGTKYEGEYKDGKKHGQGAFTYADGTKYEGEYKDGKKHGQGTRAWANGDKYVGEWKDGKSNGQGTYTYVDGTIYHKGLWEDGKPAP
jgi:hypothetical protein